MRALSAVDAHAMADIHARSFERGWSALDMATHTQNDLCLGTSDPQTDQLSSFIICRSSYDQAEILTIATHPDHREQGLAKALVDAACKALLADGVTALFLEVAEDNAAAIALYRQAGFIGIGRRPAYYRRAAGRMAALTLSKKLDA
ncbi:GNAT family N-acetyltransferase [Litorimonas sp. RW-G-Af-16]|uniref:GNAT family N-acetyltransferase n=1 Tax=Litorimonas sp. RW-G-Af-16 TaxID=3241168 RepID=UPI00390CB36D